MYPNTPKSKIVATNEILATPVTTRSASGMYALLLLLDVDALIAYIFYTVPKNACSQQILLILCWYLKSQLLLSFMFIDSNHEDL